MPILATPQNSWLDGQQIIETMPGVACDGVAGPASVTHPNLVFLQYLNPEILTLYQVQERYSARRLLDEWVRLSRYASLIAEDGLVVPASYLFEVPLMHQFLKQIDVIIQAGLFSYASPTPDLMIYATHKQREYRDELPLFPKYQQPVNTTSRVAANLMWRPRLGSASETITSKWTSELERADGIWKRIITCAGSLQSLRLEKVEKAVATAPKRLEGRAFVYRFAAPLLPFDVDMTSETRIKLLISSAYLESYLRELNAMIVCTTSLGILDCQLPRYSEKGQIQTVSFSALCKWLDIVGILPWIDHVLTWRQLLKIRTHAALRWLLGQTAFGNNSEWEVIREAVRLANFTPFAGTLRPKRARGDVIVSDKLWHFQDAIRPFLAAKNDGCVQQPPVRRVSVRQIEQKKQAVWHRQLPLLLREDIDLLVFVALAEEFREFVRLFQPVLVDKDAETQLQFYRMDIPTYDSGVCRCAATFFGRMGPVPAAVTVTRTQAMWRPSFVSNVGIAASLDDEVKVGDVVAVEVADNYLDRSKATDTDTSDSYTLLTGGEPYRCDQQLVDLCQHFEFSHPQLFASWLGLCAERLRSAVGNDARDRSLRKNTVREVPRAIVGHIASGPTVGSSTAFKRWLKHRDRNYLALDMETGGVLNAMHAFGGETRVLALRGISDYGDARKKTLDAVAKGGLRAYAMHNATLLLHFLVTIGAFNRGEGIYKYSANAKE